MPPRKKRLGSRSPIKQGGTPIKKVNPEQRAKRKKRQASKHAAYMRSETRKIVDARAFGQCEASVHFYTDGTFKVTVPEWYDATICARMYIDDSIDRCENRSRLQHHHLTYARYGGNELPEDMLKVCKRCHDFLESQHPTRHLSHHGADQ